MKHLYNTSFVNGPLYVVISHVLCEGHFPKLGYLGITSRLWWYPIKSQFLEKNSNFLKKSEQKKTTEKFTEPFLFAKPKLINIVNSNIFKTCAPYKLTGIFCFHIKRSGLRICPKNPNSGFVIEMQNPFFSAFLRSHGHVKRAWWKGLPAVDWEKGSRRCRPSTILHFSTGRRRPAFFNLPFSTGRRRPLHFSTGRRRPAFFFTWWTSTCLFQPAFFSLVDVLVDRRRCRRPFYSSFHHALIEESSLELKIVYVSIFWLGREK